MEAQSAAQLNVAAVHERSVMHALHMSALRR